MSMKGPAVEPFDVLIDKVPLESLIEIVEGLARISLDDWWEIWLIQADKRKLSV